MRYFNLFNIAILLVLASCGRSYDNPEIIDPPIVQPLILPVKITINNDAIYNVSYDGQKLRNSQVIREVKYFSPMMGS